MARKLGDRNRDFDEKRGKILERLEDRLLMPDGPQASMNELAQLADVSLSSLRHHVGGRSELWSAMLDRYGAKGAPFLAAVMAPTDLPLGESVGMVLHLMAVGFRFALLDIVSAGLAVGMRDGQVGPAFLQHILEPVLGALEVRLEQHRRQGEMDGDVRVAALSLVSPLLMAVLHQQGLGGCEVRPLDIEQTINELVRRFVRGWGTSPS